ncbi:S9 family peptidase [Reichenbachiella sp.]|uniref:S9 family peptidase n=1 Tax=Reichenbachiella sp. TaxID=2184521 RepID=UPI003B5BE705
MNFTKTLQAFIGLSLIAFSCKQTPQEQPPQQYTIEQFMDVKEIYGGYFSPDESKVLLGSKESGVYNAFEISLETGEKKQLTQATDDGVFPMSYFPNDDRFLFASDKGGNEITHVYVNQLDGMAKDLTPDSAAKANFYGWNYDRTKMFLTSNKRDQRFFDLYWIKLDDIGNESKLYETQLFYQNDKGLNPSIISNDEKFIALHESITTNNSNMYLYSVETGETKLISEHEGDADYSPEFFSLDGTELFYLTNEDYEFMYLKAYNLMTGESRVVEKEDWDIYYSYLSRTGKYRVSVINNDAKTEVKFFDGQTGESLQISGLPEGDISGVKISESENLMSFYMTNSSTPRNLYVYDFRTSEYKKLTDTMSKEINPDDLVAGEVIRFSSFDGMQIPSILYKPKGLKPGEKVPAMLMIHGGPGGQTRLNYTPRLQYFVNHGYAVLAVNNRGSSGYGKTFYAADDLRHGQDDLQDCIESKKFLATLDYIDTDKIGIMGGSYGGYMVMAALAFAPEEFAVGVNYFGVTNWLRTIRSIPPWWESFREALYTEMGNPNTEDSVALYNKSPLFFAHQITKPFIVLQGANDPRVLQVESDEMIEEARKNNVPVEYVLFDDEGHGFKKKENNITASKEVLKFLDKHLKEVK